MEALLATLEKTQIIALLGVLILLFIWESFHPFYEHFIGKDKERGKHYFRNLVMGGLNAFMSAILFAGFWLAVSVWTDENRFGVLNWLEDFAGIPAWAHAVVALFVLDCWAYIWHRMNHELPFFWRFHKVHHSDNKMDVTTASRFHFGEIFFSGIFRFILIGLFGIYFWELVAYEIAMFTVVQFHHANIGLSHKVDRILRTVIVTPNMHRVHHSRWQPETDSNYSSLFSFWDRIAKTFRLREKPEEIELGLEEYDEDKDQTVGGMLKTPLKKDD